MTLSLYVVVFFSSEKWRRDAAGGLKFNGCWMLNIWMLDIRYWIP